MKLKELLDGVTVTALRAENISDIQGLCIDSRRASPGCVFFAVPGSAADGHDFIPRALAAGAALVVAERDPGGCPVAVVPDARKALAVMAANFYMHPARRLRMTGVTGTNGKTTVTNILQGIYEKVYGCPAGLIGTNEVRIGSQTRPAGCTTPDALRLQAMLSEVVSAGCARCVMEVSSHALAQHRTWGIQYNQAVFTNLTQDHLDYHRDMEGYFAAKARLFDQADVAILNLDDAYGLRLAETPGLNVVTYSALSDKADVTAKNIRLKDNRVEFEAVTSSQIARIEWATPGLFSVCNALAAVASALTEGIRLRDIAAAIREIPPVKGRMEATSGPPGVTVIIDYAHTPDALQNLLAACESREGRIITLFGCGGDRDREKRPLMAQAAAYGSDLLVVTSDNPRGENPMCIIEDILAGLPRKTPPVIVEENRVKAIERALGEASPGDLVLLCGKGHEDYQEIGGQRYPLDERVVVAEYLKTHTQG